MADGWSVEADRLTIEGTTVEATGSVRAVLGPDRFEVDGLTADPDQAVLVHGRWVDGQGRVVTFDRATLDLVDGRIDRVELQQVEVEPCGCEDPWALSARSAVVDPDRSAVLRGGWLRILGRPVVPLPPIPIPLTRRSGLLLPTVAWGVDGLQVAEPVFVTLGPRADTTLTPELRTQRGVRGLAQVRVAGVGEADGAVGWDAIEQRVRGAASWSAFTDALSTRGELWGDPAYQATYGDSFLGRSVPWPEQRVLAGAGPIELGLDAVQEVAPAAGDAEGFGAARFPVVALGSGWLGSGSAGLDRLGTRSELAATVGVSHPTQWGPVGFTPYGSAVGSTAGLHGVVGTEAHLLGWRPVRSGIERLEPGVDVAVADDGATLGVDLGWRRTTASGQASVAGRAWVGPDGVGARTDGWWRTRRWTGWVQAALDPEGLVGVGSAGVGWTADLVGVGVAAWRAPREGPWVGPWVEVRPSDAVRLRVAARAWNGDPVIQSVEAAIGWVHPTGCLSVGLTARLDQDRALPDVGLTLGTAAPPR